MRQPPFVDHLVVGPMPEILGKAATFLLYLTEDPRIGDSSDSFRRFIPYESRPFCRWESSFTASPPAFVLQVQHFVNALQFLSEKTRRISREIFLVNNLASLGGFEPPAFRLGGERSILLSYRDNYLINAQILNYFTIPNQRNQDRILSCSFKFLTATFL